MALKNEKQYQMYLDVLDILQKNNLVAKADRDGVNVKTASVYKINQLCGKVMVVASPPVNREGTIYGFSAHAGLVAVRNEARRLAEDSNFIEGEHTGIDDTLYYYGISEAGEDYHDWVLLVDEKFEKWRETSPLYFQIASEIEKFKKKKPGSAEEFAALEKEFKRMSKSLNNIAWYRDSAVLSAECAAYIATKKDETMQKALKKLDKLNKTKGTSSKHFREMADEYAALSLKFKMIMPFLDAGEKADECDNFVQKCEKEEENAIYSESVEKLNILHSKKSNTPEEIKKTIASYEEILALFMSIEKHSGAAVKIEFCKGEITKYQAYWVAAVYKDASRQMDELDDLPEAETLSDYLYRTRKYKKITAKFKSTITYDDSEEMAKKSKKLYRAYRWKFIKKISPFVAATIAIIAVVAVVIYFLAN
ncbi:MAG: hypothetical protein FWF78_04530 [Defluviitaleaceae bacterium]|nr:hypothetical protein [Defluviitaleaceae bacterium]